LEATVADTAKKLKRGEVLIKEGDTPTSVYLIQSGKIGLMSERSGKSLEVTVLGPSQVLNEAALFSSTLKNEYTAEALQETKLLEVPIELMKQHFEKCPPGIKLMTKSLSDDVRAMRKQIKMQKMETEKTPCPQGVIHKIFTEVHLIARHIGKKNPEKPDEIGVAWNALKLYASRFFGESPQRLRSLMDLLLKLKLAELTMGKSEETEAEELVDIKFLRVQLFEDFAEFFQYHLFKGSKAEAIFVDPLALKVARALAELSAGAEVDHRGASMLQWNFVLAECKSRFKLDIKNTHLDALERKGLFVKRKSFDDGRLELSFDRSEFVKMADFWSILYEIDLWNERGNVVLVEKEEVTHTGPVCGACSGAIDGKHKFCPHCGAKVEGSAAA
jgi:hypothetical protein